MTEPGTGRADHYRIVDPKSGELFRREFKRLKDARYCAWAVCGDDRIAAMDSAGKVLRYLPVNPKAKT